MSICLCRSRKTLSTDAFLSEVAITSVMKGVVESTVQRFSRKPY